MAGGARAPAWPEPMNASPFHSKVNVSLALSDQVFVAGQHVSGKIQIESRADAGLGIGVIMVELVAIQGMSTTHSPTENRLLTSPIQSSRPAITPRRPPSYTAKDSSKPPASHHPTQSCPTQSQARPRCPKTTTKQSAAKQPSSSASLPRQRPPPRYPSGAASRACVMRCAAPLAWRGAVSGGSSLLLRAWMSWRAMSWRRTASLQGGSTRRGSSLVRMVRFGFWGGLWVGL